MRQIHPGEKMKFFAEHRRKKFLRQLKTLRHAEDDRLAGNLKTEFDAIISQLGTDADPLSAYNNAASSMKKLKLPGNYGFLRNLLDLLLVVGAVAFGLRGLYFQPFRIPTSSMQPTLYGIHFRNDLPEMPSLIRGIIFGGQKAEAVIQNDGYLDVESFSYQSNWTESTSFSIGDQRITLPGEPTKVIDYAKLDPDKLYRKGETLCRGMLVQGDHLFVERFSIYLAEPRRGDVMVFNTENLFNSDGRPLEDVGGFYYIKRLAALPGDTIKLENDQLYVRPKGENLFRRIQDIAPEFEKVYSGKGGYQGHNSKMNAIYPAPDSEYTIPEKCYFMLGDNSRFSGDSRFFGPVPRANLVGRAFFAFWPFSRRFGLVDTQKALDIPTGEPANYTFPVMFNQ